MIPLSKLTSIQGESKLDKDIKTPLIAQHIGYYLSHKPTETNLFSGTISNLLHILKRFEFSDIAKSGRIGCGM